MLLSLPSQAQAACQALQNKSHPEASRHGRGELAYACSDAVHFDTRSVKRCQLRRRWQVPAASGGDLPTNAEHPVLLVSADSGWLEQLRRTCSLAGARTLNFSDLPAASGWWSQASAVLVDVRSLPTSSLANGAGIEACPRRGKVAVVRAATPAKTVNTLGAASFDPQTYGLPGLIAGIRSAAGLAQAEVTDPEVWQAALKLGAEAVWSLPQHQTVMTERLRQWVSTGLERAVSIGVIGGSGGLGTSTLATALAVTGSKRRLQTVLVEADPLGGGIDLLLGGAQAQGSRWPQLAHVNGNLNPQMLHEDLPVMDELFVLSWDRGRERGVSAEAMSSVLHAARRGSELVVLDLPRYRSPFVDAALVSLDLCLLYVQETPRGLASAARVLASLNGLATRVEVVLRRGNKRSANYVQTTGAQIERQLAPIAGIITDDSAVRQACGQQIPPAYQGKGSVARFCQQLLDQAVPSRQQVA